MGTDLSSLRLHAHFDEGDGPVIVMLHGINSDGGDWRTVIDTIGSGYRFISLDLLGFGKSPKPDDIDYSADEHALVIENTLLDLGVEEPFLLVGYSLGGDIALRYASTYPHRLRRLFLLDAPFYLPAAELKLRGTGLKYLWELGSQRLWRALAATKEQDGFIYKLATGAIEKPLEDAFHADDIPTHWDIMSKNLTNTVNAATFVDDLPLLTMPVVFAVGVRDAIVKVNQTPALKRLKPDMEIRKITGLAADHMVLWNMPECVAEEILRDEVRELNVVWRGGQGSPLVLLHGLMDPAERWVPAAQALSARFDVAVLDLLGFGGSPRPLGLHYTLVDHAAAVLAEISKIWGAERPVTLVGEGLGGAVALECAAMTPARVCRVVAFSPALFESDSSLEDNLEGEQRASILALRERVRTLAEETRKRTRHAESAERLLVPILRSLDNAIANDAEGLLSHVTVPVRFVVPTEDAITPTAFLAKACAEHPDFELVEMNGERGLPYSRPGDAIRGIDPEDALGIAAAEAATPVEARTSIVESAAGAIEGSLLRAGLLNLAAAGIVLALHPMPSDLLTLGFAAWLVIASLSTVVGALGMRRHTAGTRFSFVTTALPAMLLGVGGLVLASFVFADPEKASRLFGLLVAVYATARGAADIYLARSVEGAARPKWSLYAAGAIGLVTALAILFGPQHGRGLVRLSLALYLATSGAALIAHVVSSRRAAEKRLREILHA